MSLATQQIVEHSGGTRKQIEMDSMDQIFDNLQITQYQFPVKSTIRELVSNGVDSIKERNIAVEILTGKAKVEDYFIQRDEYEASNFDPTYYDLKWLDTASKVQIIYEVGNGLEKDKVRIIDPGVGLGKNRTDGKSRLEGYFKLAYSSKRNLKAQFALGKFGLGAKSPLSTNVPFYTVISRYNGKEYHFNVYSSYVQSTVPSMSIATTGGYTNNQFDVLYEGTEFETKAYWLPTQRRNGVEIVIESKKSKKSEYEDAVKGQLLYFKDVEFVQVEDGVRKEIPVSAKVLYEDDYLIVSDNKQYSKPHLVINQVNYGYIDFAELELQQMLGNVGIKVSLDDVAVTQSRESVIWNEKTKTMILERFRQASQIAQNLVQEKLNEKDLFVWFQTWLSIRNNKFSVEATDAVGQLSHIVDISQLQPAYSLDDRIVASSARHMFPGMQVQKIELSQGKRAGTVRKKLKREDVLLITDMNPNAPILLTKGKPSLASIRYFATVNPSGFYLIRYPSKEITGLSYDPDKEDDENDDLKAYQTGDVAHSIVDGKTSIPKTWTKYLDNIHGHDLTVYSEVNNFLIKLRKAVIGYMESSTVPIKAQDIEVPEDFKWIEDEEVDVEQEVQQKLDSVSPAERRKLEERVVAFTPRGPSELPAAKKVNGVYTPVNIFEYQKIEPKLIEVQNLEGEVYYGFNDEESRQALELAALITRPGNKVFAKNMVSITVGKGDVQEYYEKYGMEHSKVYDSRYSQYYLPGSPITLLKIAKDQERHYKMYHPIQEFFIKLEDDTLTMSESLVKWHTARRINEEIDTMSFLSNFQIFNPEIYDKYIRVRDYHTSNYRDLHALATGNKYFGVTEEVLSDLIDLHEKLVVVQNFVKDNPEEVGKARELMQSLFEVNASNAVGIDDAIIQDYNELVEYTKQVAPLLNQLDPLTDVTLSVSEDLEREIRFYLNAKGL